MNRDQEDKRVRVVVVGDMSFRGRYHLGDEAMCEVAIQQLTRRQCEVTVVAGTPQISSEMYGVPAVPRFGFVGIPQRADKFRRLDEILAGVRGDSALPAGAEPAVSALRAADALLIAGGGNLNTIGEHHVFERLALVRIAREFGLPIYVTSQTVGPHLRQPDQELVREIAESARVFGVRESATADLVRGICGEQATIVRTVDDAVLLDPSALDVLPELRLPERFVLGSFAADPQTSGLDAEAYFRNIAAILDEIVAESDRDVLLVSHLGTFDEGAGGFAGSDDLAHARICGHSTSGRVRVIPLLSASQLLALTAGADFTVSTRYHPLVFGTRLGIPAIGIVHSYYSAVRMRGALANAGMEDFALPLESWLPLLGGPLLRSLKTKRDDFAEQFRRAGESQRAYQERWWDGIVGDLLGTGSILRDDYPLPSSVTWTDSGTAGLLAHVRVSSEATQLTRLDMQMTHRDTDLRQRRTLSERQRVVKEHDALKAEVVKLREELNTIRAELRHRSRPPGADLRDRLRARIQSWRR